MIKTFQQSKRRSHELRGKIILDMFFLGDGGLALLSSRPPIIASFDSEVTDDDDEVDKKFEEYYQYGWS